MTPPNKLISLGAKPQEARSILPNSLKTEIVMTMNLREWLHFFKIKDGKKYSSANEGNNNTLIERVSEKDS